MRKEVSKNMSVFGFIEKNTNLNVKYEIDGITYDDDKNIPSDVMEREVYHWTTKQWEGIIVISTYTGLFESKLEEFNISFDQFTVLYGIWECELSAHEKFNLAHRATDEIMKDIVEEGKK